VALDMMHGGPFVALVLQPDDEPIPDGPPPSPFTDGDVLLFVLFVVVVGAVFGFDMMRTWWETNRWKREARRRRREMR
jgi:hypothetical protein